MASTERWFSDEELAEMSRPTMDRAIEALDVGDTQRARELCSSMKYEWQMLHDLLVEMITGLVTFVQQEMGDEGVEKAWDTCLEKSWRHHHDTIRTRQRREIVPLLAATWRAHSVSGVGRNPASFTITEDEEKITFTMHPCGSGQRLFLRGGYEGDNAYGTTEHAHTWSYGRAKFPLYCTHCTFMNETLPMRWWGNLPLYPSDPPGDFGSDPCVWYWYKSENDIPERFWARHGKTKPPVNEEGRPA